MSDTPRTDREVYAVSKNDIGFEVVNPALCRQLERELAALTEWRRLALSSAGFAGLKTAEMLRLRKALADLIALKDYRDAHGKDEDDYYQTAKPLAWIAAREAIDKS